MNPNTIQPELPALSAQDRLNRWLKRVFVNKNLFYLWSGQVISQAGDSIFEIGLLWLLLELTGSNAITGLIAMAAYLPTLLFGLYSGALVDRFDRPTIIHQIVPEEMQGRIFSMISVAVYGFTAISIALTGAAAEIIPINIIYAIAGLLAAASGAAGWFVREFREAA